MLLMKKYFVKRGADMTKSKSTESRNILSSFFITLLIGFAFQNVLINMSQLLCENGFILYHLSFSIIFMLVALRFFIGNQLHLLNVAYLNVRGVVWLYDLTIIILQSIVLTMISNLTIIEASKGSHISFYFYNILLYSIDVFWIISQWALGLIFPVLKRSFIPWGWAILNSFLIVFTLIILFIFKNDVYAMLPILIILLLNFIAFIADVILVDYYHVVDEVKK